MANPALTAVYIGSYMRGVHCDVEVTAIKLSDFFCFLRIRWSSIAGASKPT